MKTSLKLVAVSLLPCVMCGCMRTLREVQNTCSNGPAFNEVVENKARDGFEVFQILDDGHILVNHPGWQHFKINDKTGIRADTYTESFLDLRVLPMVSDYVDGQPLKNGFYRYVGTYEYTTVKDKKRKIRDYVEVPASAQ